MRAQFSYALLAAVAVSVYASFAMAAPILPGTAPIVEPTTIYIDGTPLTIDPGTPQWHADPTDTSNPDTNYWYIPTSASTYTVAGATVRGVWEAVSDDPIMGLSFAIDNTSGGALTISTSKTVTVPAQIAAVAGPTMYKGTLGITLTDDDGGGALATDNLGKAIYQASIDGTPVLELDSLTALPGPFNEPHPFSFSVADGDSQTESVNSDFLSPGPALNSTMSIRLTLVLSANDSVAITSNFTVLPDVNGRLPEPASLALLGLGTLSLLKRRR